MSTVESVLIVVLALLAAVITVVVVLQQGRGADIGAAFGAGGANTIFGSTGLASPLAKLTWGLAGVFLVLCMSLAYLAKQRSEEANAVFVGDVPAVPAAAGGATAARTDTPVAPANSDVPVLPSAAGNSQAGGQGPSTRSLGTASDIGAASAAAGSDDVPTPPAR